MEINAEKTWCFTGHRPNKLYGYDKNEEGNIKLRLQIKTAIIYLYQTHGITTFISGMALGVDQWAAEIVLELKETIPELKLVAAIPCRDHSITWPQSSKQTYLDILDKTDLIVMVNKMRYYPQCMQLRNEWMVDKSCGQIAVWDGTNGGTANCIKYANEKGKRNRIRIHPKTFEIEFNVNA